MSTETNVTDTAVKPALSSAEGPTPPTPAVPGTPAAPAKSAAPAAAAPKKRSETENVLEGHADVLKAHGKTPVEKMRGDGRKSAALGIFLCAAFIALAMRKYGAWTDFMATYHAIPWKMRIASTLGAFFLFGVVAPVPFYKVWMGYVAAPLGWFMTRLILGLTFFLLFTPYAIVMKIVGNDPLRRARHDGSYWIPRVKQRERNHFETRF